MYCWCWRLMRLMARVSLYNGVECIIIGIKLVEWYSSIHDTLHCISLKQHLDRPNSRKRVEEWSDAIIMANIICAHIININTAIVIAIDNPHASCGSIFQKIAIILQSITGLGRSHNDDIYQYLIPRKWVECEWYIHKMQVAQYE